ncbi:TRAP transporter small permease subunit [Ruegeria arenilitoris]|uniref:TRAP transporter small permease subunit n=1 Tax=Ruegeria arenilitoris TaxID=1173585 RepID=UPI0014799A83|nr:TRAP transporter small permease subunit [Ruegeria arenilitoris]
MSDTQQQPTPVTPTHDPFDQGRIDTQTDRVIDRLIKPTGWLVLIVAVISVYEVVSRYGFNAPTKWVHETSTFLIAIVFLIGGARAMARNQHVTINLLQYLLPRGGRRALRLTNSFLMILICLGLVYVSALTAWTATHARPGLPFYLERSGTYWNPPYPGLTKVVMFIATVLLLIQSVAQFIHRVKHDNGERGEL